MTQARQPFGAPFLGVLAAELLTSCRLYAGMPSQTAQPLSTRYAYPAFWEAALTECSWSESDCTLPLPATKRCLFFKARLS